MEAYLLITGVVTLIGVICIIIYLEKGSRATLARFNKEREDSQQLLQTLVAVHGLITETNGLLNKLHDSQSQQTNENLTRLDELKSQISAQLEKLNTSLTTTLKSGVEQICQSQNEQGQSLRKTLRTAAKDIESKVEGTTKEVQALKSSLEESVKF